MAFEALYGTGFEAGSIGIVSSALRYRTYINSSVVHTGSYSCNIAASANEESWIRFEVPGSHSELYIGAWLWITDIEDFALVTVVLSDGKKVGLRYDIANQEWDAYINGSVVQDGTVSHSINAWHHLSLHIIIDDASGVIEWKVDGVSDTAYSGDTKPGGGSTISYVEFYGDDPGLSGANTFYLDDFVFGAGGWPADYRWRSVVPNADTAQKDFTPSTGTDNYDLVNDVGPNDSEYVYTDTPGHKDLYDLADFSLSANETIGAVMQWMRSKKDAAGDALMRPLLTSGSTESAGSSNPITTAWAYYWEIYTKDPNTDDDWDEAAIDALQIGQEYV